MDSLLISEDFYSIQGEGITSGYPSYFIRLANCNLTCGATPEFVNQFKKNEEQNQDLNYDPGSFKGDLHKENKATWTCDTIPVWTKGQEQPFSYLPARWIEYGVYDLIKKGIVHIIWTGGEPTIPKHQQSIVKFHEWFQSISLNTQYNPYIEIETNGTFYIGDALFKILTQINCSPKLSNSGLNKKYRINSEAIKRIMSHPKYQFKFVVSNEDDIKEMFSDFIEPFRIPLTNIVCMPGLDSRDNFHERTKFIMEMAIKYKFIGLTRLHVSAWDKTTGV